MYTQTQETTGTERLLVRSGTLLLGMLISMGFLVASQTGVWAQAGLPENIPDRLLQEIRNENFTKAASELESYIDEQSSSPAAWYLLGYVRNRLSIHEEAHDALSVAQRQMSRTPDVLHRELGYALAGQGQWAGALENFRRVSDLTPRARLKKGQSQLELKQYEEALSTLEPLIANRGETAIRARLLRARAYSGLVRRDQAARSEAIEGLRMSGADRLHLSLRNLLGVLNVFDPALSRQYLDLFTRETVDWRRGQFIRRFEHEKFRDAIQQLASGRSAAEGEDAVTMINRIRDEASGEAKKKLTKLSNFIQRVGDLSLPSAQKRTLVQLTLNPILSGTGITIGGQRKEQAKPSENPNATGTSSDQG